MHSGYNSQCGFNLITMSCRPLVGNKYEGILKKIKNTIFWRCESENHKLHIQLSITFGDMKSFRKNFQTFTIPCVKNLLAN